MRLFQPRGQLEKQLPAIKVPLPACLRPSSVSVTLALLFCLCVEPGRRTGAWMQADCKGSQESQAGARPSLGDHLGKQLLDTGGFTLIVSLRVSGTV